MLKLAIAEDEPGYAAELEEYVSRFFASREEKAEITLFSDGFSLVDRYQPVWDILLLDIEMPRMNGMAAARRIREADPAVVLIFITNLAQYAIQGYEVGALDYVLKPVGYEDLSFRLLRAVRAVKVNRDRQFTVQTAAGMRRFRLRALTYVEVRGHNLIYHLDDGEVSTRGTMEKAEQELSAWGFLRCNNCYLVNPQRVDWVDGYIVQVAGEPLQISHPRRKRFVAQLGQWLSEGGNGV